MALPWKKQSPPGAIGRAGFRLFVVAREGLEPSASGL